MQEFAHQAALPFRFGVTVGDVEGWQASVAIIDEQVAALAEQRKKLTDRIDAAHALFALLDMPPSVSVPLETALSKVAPPLVEIGEVSRETDDSLSIIAAVRGVVLGKLDGIVPWEAKRLLMQGPLASRLTASDKGFYNAISRLANKGEIVRHHGRLYGPRELEGFLSRVAAGDVDDEPSAGPQPHSPMGHAIAEIVNSQPGIRGGEIIARLRSDPEFAAALMPHTTGLLTSSPVW